MEGLSAGLSVHQLLRGECQLGSVIGGDDLHCSGRCGDNPHFVYDGELDQTGSTLWFLRHILIEYLTEHISVVCFECKPSQTYGSIRPVRVRKVDTHSQ